MRRAKHAIAAVVAVVVATAGGPATATAARPTANTRPDPDAARAITAADQLPAHAASEGYVLGSAAHPDAAASRSSRCPASAAVRSYDVAAIDVDITLNRYLDHDPQGRMYVLEQDLPRVRDEEALNGAARADKGDPAVSVGLQGDAIQPLTLRVDQGECLRIRLRNALNANEPASLHLHGAALRVASGHDGPAIATNRNAIVRPGQRVTYEWMVGAREQTGSHYFHSHGDERRQTNHGLFGAVVVEPHNATWLDPRTSRAGTSGWDAIVRPPHGAAFREFALYYHEVGDELFQPLDRNGELVPLVDPITRSYRPDGRALNYRSEPFLNRLQLQKQVLGRVDESTEYSSYSFGDPATPIMRSYLGDPVTQRVIHGGSEVFHVHHVHGGATRWRRQPDAEPSTAAVGLDKHPPLRPLVSERTDSQSLGPSETFDITDECGSGGCQQSAGDFMYHCHVTFHYFSGMWGIWRVYNTRQDGEASTDTMPPLAELPGRNDRVQAAVPAQALANTTVDSYGQTTSITAQNLDQWVGAQLPPPGVPRGYDASVWDWQPGAYLGEPETTKSWPGYRSPAPGTRPPLLFDPRTGRPAYPFLRPHLGQRPPFAPDHGPAPFLDPVHTGTDPPPPGANGPGSDCPAGTRQRQVPINVITAPVPLNAKANLVDPFGELYVLRDQEDAVRASPAARQPLVIRANAGQDCLDVLLRSELTDNAGDPFSKVSAHIHFVQFDVQGSDGVDTGFNYEQTIRPYALAGERVTAPAPAGANVISVTDAAARFQPGAVVGVGLDRDTEFESHRVLAVNANALTLDAPLTHPHRPGEILSTEFVRYRWYPDSQFGTAFFHDHVNVINSGRHGLFGSLIVEPPGSTWVDPHTGAPAESGPVADIRSDQPISTDVRGSFRELVALLQDDNPLTAIGESSGSSLDLRAEPLDNRARDPSMVFSSAVAGDPATPLLEAYLGDPVAIRTLVGSNNDVHSLHVDGHWFRVESWDNRSPPTNTVNVGISERYDVVLPAAGGSQRRPGDYLYYDGRTFKLREGTWGLLRVYDGAHAGLDKLPGRETTPPAASTVCPPGAPRRSFNVDAVDVALPMLGGAPGKAYVLDDDRDAVASGRVPPSPLVLHVDVGDCLTVTLRNMTTDGPVSFHTDMLAADPRDGGGVAAGNDPDQALAPGGMRTFTYYASPDVGETTGLVRDFGDPLHNPGLGLYGAVVVGPRGARYRDPATGADVGSRSSWQVDVVPAGGRPYRDFSLFFQDEDAGIGSHRMPYRTHVDGTVAVNYNAAPLADRLDQNPDPALVFDPAAHGDPPTPLLRAYAGDPVKVHVLSPWSEQAQVFSIEGHRWPLEPGRPRTPMLSAIQLSATDALTLSLDGGAGGPAQVPGDYLYGDHRLPYEEAGMWGLFRVLPACGGHTAGIRPLAGSCATTPAGLGWPLGVVLLVGLGGAALLVALVYASARRLGRSAGVSRP